ncbi:MAG: hypothetical protein ACYC3S_11135 [Chloroflexota bacterium]
MSVDDVLKVVLTGLAALGGAGAIIVGIATWLARLIADQLNQRTAAKYQKELEELRNQYTVALEGLKAETAERRDVGNNLLAMMSSGFSLSHGRIVTSVERLWDATLRLERLASPVMFINGVLLPQEIEGAVPPERIRSMISIPSDEQLTQTIQEIAAVVEPERPFLGETLWAVHKVHVAFSGRLVWKIQSESSRGQFYAWDKNPDGTSDGALRNLLATVLGEGELDSIISGGVVGAPSRIESAVEARMLSEISQILFGRRMATLSLQEHQRLISALQQAAPPTSLSA